MEPVCAGGALVPDRDAARLLGIPARDVRFLLAAGVLEGEGEASSADSLVRLALSAAALLAPGETLASGLERVVLDVRAGADATLVARGPVPSPSFHPVATALGAVMLGEHPDGLIVLAVPESEGAARRASETFREITGEEVRAVAVEPALLASWGAAPAAHATTVCTRRRARSTDDVLRCWIAGEHGVPGLGWRVERVSGDRRGVLARIEGHLDGRTAGSVRTFFSVAIDLGVRRVFLDLSGIEWVNSTGLGFLVKYGDLLQEKEGGLALLEVPRKTRALIELLGLDAFFTLADDLDSATLRLAGAA